MSQRGTYSADPALTCPGVDEFTARSVGLVYDAPSTGRLHVDATRACRDRLTGLGADLGAYDSSESAADYADLRVALGLARWNVFGISYGTDLALIYLREHPEGIRSVRWHRRRPAPVHGRARPDLGQCPTGFRRPVPGVRATARLRAPLPEPVGALRPPRP
ncbi:hypothetical protein ACIOD1_09525 [Streptomyces sp. NPDC088097]|uniref:hypothetical protein n=1 Tax=Streptomyces sp. NPDC088097 TaxID=3365823 RepID=UPI0038177C3B